MAILFECTEDENDGIYSFQDMKVVVTGGIAVTPAVFADFVTFDRAGTAVLLEAEACGVNHTLDEQIRPVEDLAIQITFTIAGSTAGAGDTLDVTGTDWRGAAQNESINVAAGDGAYTGAEYWRTITDIDCTGWADGTLKVEQDRWGFIWDYGDKRYRLDCYFDVGAGGATYFRSRQEQIFISIGYYITVAANATLTSGTKVGTTKGKHGSTWLFDQSETVVGVVDYGNYHGFEGAGILLIYGSRIESRLTLENENYISRNPCLKIENASSEILSIELLNIDQFRVYAECTLKNVKFSAISDLVAVSGATVDNVRVEDHRRDFNIAGTAGGPFTFANVNIDGDLYIDWNQGTLYLTDVIIGGSITNSFDAWAVLGHIYRTFTCNIHVTDKDGANLSGVIVDCENTNATAEWAAGTVTTAADGTIAEQTIDTYHWYAGPAEEDFKPHKFTLSKAGYETLVLDNVTVDGPIVWHLEMLGATGPGVQKQWR